MTDTIPAGGQLYDVGGRSLSLYRAGTGRPTVVFLPGAGMFGLGYYNLQQRTAAFATSVLYDRGGTGWSDDVSLPRAARDVARELHDLLAAAGLPGPYVFVAHSLGGIYARRFAQLYPADVAGFLLLDPAHEDYAANEPEVARKAAEAWKNQPMPEFTPEMLEGYRPILGAMYAEWPAEVREPLIDRHITRFKAGLLESANVDAIYDEVRNGGAVPVVPTIVYTALGIDATQLAFNSEEVVRAQNQAKLVTNTAYVESVPGAEHRVLEDASHVMIHTQHADEVMRALSDVIARALDRLSRRQ
jgi:pimeloyl-ACP methyl ester carboxylesterase